MVTVLVTTLLLAAVLVCLIYPGELSHVSPRLNRWLYDRSAASYNEKWSATAYHDPAIENRIVRFAQQAVASSGVRNVLDLGCGTGRGIRLVSPVLPATTRFTGIDFSTSMIQGFGAWVASQGRSLEDRIDLLQEDLADWAERDPGQETFGLILMLEVGEFVPNVDRVLRRAASVLASDGGLLMTRPARFWHWFFPGRIQSRRLLARHLVSLGFTEPEFVKWRGRYELVFCNRLQAQG